MKFTGLPKRKVLLAMLLVCSFASPGLAQYHDDLIGWNFSASPQTVQVQTLRGNYTTVFQNEVSVYTNGRAVGSLFLGTNDGTLHELRVFSGFVQFRNGEVGAVLLRARLADPDARRRGELVILMHPDPSEPCRIYDILGWQGGLAHFEAETLVEVIRN